MEDVRKKMLTRAVYGDYAGLKDEPDFDELTEMYFSVKVKNGSGQIDEEKTANAIANIIYPLVIEAEEDLVGNNQKKYVILKKAASKYSQTALLNQIIAKLQFEN